MARLLTAVLAAAAAAVPALASPSGLAARDVSADAVNTTTCNGNTYVYEELAGYGYISTFARDKFGDTVGGIGSAIWMNQTSWTLLPNGSYTGVIWTLPDRGWNTEGTLNFIPRVHIWTITFTPEPNATVESPSGPNINFSYLNTLLLFGPDGKPTTGLDADGSGTLSYPGFPPLPRASYTGDGFGNPGCGNNTSHRIPLDSEGLYVNSDGSFWISDEYGPYVYHFDPTGKMTAAIRPAEAIIPKRNGSDSFSADSPFFYINGGKGDDVIPADNPTGRDNNHGFEGLTFTDDGNTLWALLQAATNQEGGTSGHEERYTRFVKYDVTNPQQPVYLAEYVVPLPVYNDPTKSPSKNPQVAAQSEIHAIPGTNQFFVLARDSGAGHGQALSDSLYRNIDVFDISGATDILAAGVFDCATCAVASASGVLNSTVTPAEYCEFLSFNVNPQLNRFGVHNGGDQDQFLLNEKWESIAMVPVDPVNGNAGNEWYIFSMSDNDFITQEGYLEFGKFQYADASGFSLDNQALAFKVQLPLP